MKKIWSKLAIVVLVLILSGLNVFAKAYTAAAGSAVTAVPEVTNAIQKGNAGNTINAVSTDAAAAVVTAIATAVPAAANKAQYELEDVIITGTKTKLKIKDSPAAVNVVTEEKKDQKTVIYSDDLVTGLPGVQVARTEKGDQSTNVTLRGIYGTDKNLILLDGHSLQNPLNGRVFWNRVPIDLVERVEVVRGPFSSLYGKYALGGVINIITKEPQARSLNVTTSYDNTGILTTAVDFRDKPNDKFAYYLAFENERLNGYSYYQYVQKTAVTGTATNQVTGFRKTTDSLGNVQYIIGETAKPDLQNYIYSGKLFFTPAEGHKLTLIANYSTWDQPTEDGVLGKSYLKDSSGNIVSSGTVALAGTGKQITVNNKDFFTTPGQNIFYITSLDYTGKLNEILNLSASVEYTSGSNLLSVGNLSNNATAFSGSATGGGQGSQQEKKATVQSELFLGANHIIVGGGYYNTLNKTADAEHPFWRDEHTFTEPYNRYGSDGYIYSAYAQDEWKILGPLTAFIGARYDNWSSKNGYVYNTTLSQYQYYSETKADVVSPKLSLVYRPSDDISIRASAGTAFNPPTSSELYSYSSSATGQTISNPDLVPEKDTAWEFGGEYTLPTKTTLSATYFENYLKDLIYTDVTFGLNNYTTTQYVNAGKAVIKGVEAEIKQPIFPFLDASANYTYTYGKIAENFTAPQSVGKFIPNVAEHTANFGITYKLENFTAAFTETYQSKIYRTSSNADTVNGVQGSYDPFATSDLKLTYSFGNAKITAGVENIGGLQYYTIYKTPGRTYNIGLKYSWL